MRLLLDTHVLAWALAGDRTLPERVMRQIEDPANAVHASIASHWELTIKRRLGKLPFDPAVVLTAARRVGMVILPIAPEHIDTLHALPSFPDHRDPFDHLLVAQAIAEDLTLVTADRNAGRYPVRVMAAE